jgi:hypothetical protein
MGTVPEAPRIQGKTGPDGVLRLPVFDDRALITLKVDAAELLQPGGRQPPRDNARVPPTPEEEKAFLTYTLDAGALRDVHTGSLPSASDGSEGNHKLAVRQRLHNLGYGLDELEKWDDAFERLAVRQFQRNERLSRQDGTLDVETEDRLAEEHEPRRPSPTAEETAEDK